MTSRAQSARRGVRRRWIAVTGLVLVSLGTLTAFMVQPDAVAIDGVALSDMELAVGEDRVQRAVEQHGGTDAEVRAAAIDALRDDLALFATARELGVSDVERPADILERLDDVNRERDAAHESGEVVYGPVSHDLRTFYGKALSQLRTATVKALDEQDVIAEGEVRTRFDQDSAEWAASASTYRLTGVRLTAADEESAQGQSAGLTTEAFETALSSADPASILHIDVTALDLESGSWSPEQVDLIRAAEPDNVIGPFPSEGAWIVYRLDEVEVDRESAYDMYRVRIRHQLLEELLDQRISAEREAQDVTGR